MSTGPSGSTLSPIRIQESQGTADEKIPYAMTDLAAIPMHGCIAYAGAGFSAGVLQMLRSSELAAYCLPDVATLESGAATIELDQMLAIAFGWWDVLLRNKRPIEAE